jgi:hypothetical protein
MYSIIRSHILMNFMIRWIENGFMHFPDGSVSPITEKDEVLESSAICRELPAIAEESLGEIEPNKE